MNAVSSFQTPRPAAITGRMLRRGLLINIVAGALGVSWWGLTQGMPLTLFFEALGASGLRMGLVTAILQVAFLMQVPAALFAEKLRFRKRVWGAVTLANRAVWFLPPLFLALFGRQPERVALWVLLVLAASALLGQSVTALWFSWMADLVPESLRGRFWGKRQSWGMVASLLTMGGSGYLLDLFPPPRDGAGSWWGFSLIFLIGAAVGCADIVIHMWVPEPPPQPRRVAAPWYRRIFEPLRERDFRWLTLAMGLYTFAVGLLTLSVVYLKRDFHVSYSHLAALSIASALGTMFFGVVAGYAMDRIGGRTFGAIMIAAAPLCAAAWFLVRDEATNFLGLVEGLPLLGPAAQATAALLPPAAQRWLEGLVLPQSVWIHLFAGVLGGALYGSIGICQYHLTAAIVPREGRTLAMAVHWSLVGLIGSAGAVCAGQVLDLFARHPPALALPNGTPFSFHHALVLVHMALMWFAVLPALLRIRPRRGELPLGTAVSRLLVANPFRTVANIYSIGAPVTRRRRAQAVRRLGEHRAAIAVADLIEKLDDPSLDVREETVQALGSIGSPEAIDALIAKLNDPNSDLAPQIAKALRVARAPRSVEALLRKLDDADRETTSESARALGEIGDRRAVPSLLNLLSRSRDAKIVSASSDALARLGELAALYEILPRLRQTRNPVLKRSLAVAVGDLLGRRDEFYKVLTVEQTSRGSEAERMLGELRHEIATATRERLTEQGRRLQERAARVQTLYEEERYAACVTELFDLAIGLAALRWGVEFGGDSLAAIYHLIWRDQRFGIGVWYLDYLRAGFGAPDVPQPDDVDALLGIYFLYSQGLGRGE
mgnify:CR=1 FL=1